MAESNSSEPQAGGLTFDAINLVSNDVDAALAFYTSLGVDVPESSVWRTGSGTHHVGRLRPGSDVAIDVDSQVLAEIYGPNLPEGATTIIGFRLDSHAAVDETFERLTGEGYTGLAEPRDLFWGARFAMLADPDGRPVGLQGPIDPALKSPPPAL